MNRRLQIGLSLIVCAWTAAGSSGQEPEPYRAYPGWWLQRGMANTNSAPSDYSAANQGQAKWMAAGARAELDVWLPGGAGTAVSTLVGGFSSTGNYDAVNVGQLKELARPFYDRLIQVGMATSYPWTPSIADDYDFAGANVGQLKNLFSFSLDGAGDGDGDGLADWWEILHFGTLLQDGRMDSDGDGVRNGDEFARGESALSADTDGDGVSDDADANPASNADSDGDGMPDDWESAWFGRADGSGIDSDGDGATDLAEYRAGTDPTRPEVIVGEGQLPLTVYRPRE